MCAQSLSHVNSFVTPWTVARQTPMSIGFPRQEYWSGLPFPSLGDLPDPGIKPTSLASLALAGRFFTTEPPGKPKATTAFLINAIRAVGLPVAHIVTIDCLHPISKVFIIFMNFKVIS